ncbi:helix-turn-helix domain-containing protein [Nocardia uniformis]|uniref:Helix-turn-helix domain-containing protein n=1 Tax=Nocardia uniformis TaxID=53432 RepID=A0A849BWP9_9NOCA|nr:helix-turn-helix transcriptional regulator [Nocardia uniformis]NNH71023.1 helix-turn-helix domain-containing protein [Nocardia uniformis]
MTGTSPTVANWELMLRIRNRADERGVKTGVIAKALDVSQQYWSALTRGRGTLSEDKLKILMNLLEFDADEQTELLALRDIAKGRSPFAEYSALFNEHLMRFYGLEAGAQSIRSFENGVIPGLLQTEDYIRVLMKASVTTGRPTEVEQRVSARRRRQQRLDGPDPLELSVVMGEAALMYQVGSEEVQRQQLQHLIALAEEHTDTLDIRVIPYSAGGAIASLNSATFHLLDFQSARLPTVGWVESAAYGEIADDPKRVTALDYLYNQIQTIALNRKQSLDVIHRVASQQIR